MICMPGLCASTPRKPRSTGSTRHAAGHACGPPAHQGARARPASQGLGAGGDRGAAGAIKKAQGDLAQGRGRMIGLQDRQQLARDIQIAHHSGARLHLACQVAGIDVRTLQRYKATGGLANGDARPQALRPQPSHALTEAERQRLLQVANAPRFANVPPARIVPMLADDGVYLAASRASRGCCVRTAELPPWPRSIAAGQPRAQHPCDEGARPGVVLGHDLAVRPRGRALVLPVPDHEPVHPQARGLRGARHRPSRACHTPKGLSFRSVPTPMTFKPHQQATENDW